MTPESHYLCFARAYVRGVCPELGEQGDAALFEAARERGLGLHGFKRTAELPRVRRVLGILKGFAPTSLLDMGSGGGAFLWPLLDEMPAVEVTAVDTLAHRVADLQAVARGGVDRLRAEKLDAADLPWDDGSFDAVTVLEVLEHVPAPEAVARHAVRLARTAVVATVPAKEDNNEEHVRLFTPASLTELFERAGAHKVQIEHVLNHRVAVVTP